MEKNVGRCFFDLEVEKCIQQNKYNTKEKILMDFTVV